MPDTDFHTDEDAIAARPAEMGYEGQEETTTQHNRQIPGNEGFYTSGNSGGANTYNNPEEIMSFPADDPGRYLPRAIITEQWLKRMVRIRGRVARMYTGFEDPLDGAWFYMVGTAAIGGRARHDFVVVATGDRQVEIAGKSGGLFAGIGNRLFSNSNRPLG